MMRAPVLQTLAVSRCQLPERLSLSGSSAHISPHQPQNPERALPQRRRHGFDPVERWQLGNEAGLTSVQAGRGPPCRSKYNVVLDSSFAPLNNIKMEDLLSHDEL